jgi:serine/threonine-protein kinase
VARLSHPNLVGVIDAGDDGGHPYIVFEYVPGETLKQRIEEQHRLPLDEATAYAIEIGRGLAAAHAARLVHRDVKPQNVLIDPEGRAQITDFGIARSLEAHGLTATGRVLGTTDYVSPEQAMGRDADQRTDVYSLGVVLYEMLTGEVPFMAETQVGVAMKHVNEQIPDVQAKRPEVSAALADAVDRATAKEPADRYADMNELLADLEGALEVEISRAGGGTEEATTVLDSVPRKRRLLTRRRVSWAGALLLIAAAAAAIAFAALTGEDSRSGGDSPPPEPDAIGFASAVDFDPQGGDGEHPEEVGEAIDGDGATGWTTETYEAGLAGAPKTGVGLMLEAESPVTATELVLGTDGGGWSFDVYGTAERNPPSDPPIDEAGGETGAWGDPLAQGATADGKNITVPLESAGESRWLLVWITDLGNEQSAEITGAEVVAG